MELYKVLDEKCCDINFKAKDKANVIRQLSILAKKSDILKGISLEIVEQTLLEREKQGTTGFGDSVAIPHGKIEGMKKFLCFIAVSHKGITFDAMDNKKSKIFVVLLGPKTSSAIEDHLKLLSSISIILAKKSVRKEIINSSSVASMTESFIKFSNISEKELTSSTKFQQMQIILYLEEYLYDILEIFIEEDIEGASISDSYGMGEYISKIPLFADFIGFMRENKNKSKTITTLIPENKVLRVVKRIEAITGDLSKKQGAVIIVSDVAFFKGTMRIV